MPICPYISQSSLCLSAVSSTVVGLRIFKLYLVRIKLIISDISNSDIIPQRLISWKSIISIVHLGCIVFDDCY